MIVLESRTPIWGFQDGLQYTRKVDKHVADKEEPIRRAGRGVVIEWEWHISSTNMVRIGATRSREAISTPISDRHTVSRRAKLGSPFSPVRLKKLRKDRRLSLAIACMRRGAPVRDCSPAPSVENSAPIRMTHCEGHARRATVRPAASPN